MKWYSVKKYKPLQNCFLFINAKWPFNSNSSKLEVVYFEDGIFYEWNEDNSDYSDNITQFITHFCIPDPIEIDE